MSYLVTGANRGLGLEFVRQLATRGENVIATARNPEGATALNALDVRVEALDVGDPDSVAAFAARLGDRPIAVLINNAGYGVRSVPLEELDVEALDVFFQINTLGPLRVTRALLPNLRAGSKRRIAHVTSKMGSITDNGSGGAYGYRASKAALNAINKSLSIDLAPEGFTSVVLHPGWVQTDMGGPSAAIGVEESVRGMLSVVDGLGADHNGRFFNYDGSELPW